MGDRTLHDKAKRVLPDALIPGGKRYWVAVIHHSKDPSADLVEEDFLWVKCHKVLEPRIKHSALWDSHIYRKFQYPKSMNPAEYGSEITMMMTLILICGTAQRDLRPRHC